MKSATAWLAGAVLGLAMLAYAGRHQLKSLTISQSAALQNANVRAFLAMIRHFESAGSYRTLYHPSHSDPYYDPSAPMAFYDYSTHPDIKVYFLDPRTGKRNYSTAAGAYQITHPTWWGLSKLPGAPADFGPAAQDWYAVALLKENGALDPIVNGDFQTAIKLASKTWASLPYTASMQHHVTLATAQTVYENNGGMVA